MFELPNGCVPENPETVRVLEWGGVNIGNKIVVCNQLKDIIGSAIAFFIKLGQVERSLLGQSLMDALCDVDWARGRGGVEEVLQHQNVLDAALRDVTLGSDAVADAAVCQPLFDEWRNPLAIRIELIAPWVAKG